MARAKTKQSNKPAAKSKSKPTAKSKRKASRSKAKAKAKPPGEPKRSPAELAVEKLLASDAAGNIDDVFGIVDELHDLNRRLAKKSPLRPQWNKFFDDCTRIMGQSVGEA